MLFEDADLYSRALQAARTQRCERAARCRVAMARQAVALQSRAAEAYGELRGPDDWDRDPLQIVAVFEMMRLGDRLQQARSRPRPPASAASQS